ncbi:hypothetical protein [Mesorhizobium sp. WSM2561]|uniref:RipA family octameric membrane protein n=1 Tax=Mesorhizobium sp. WSM2561 TaxID=1040985 RepID=UPI00048491CB|nr:hypothetical protein [Mesorhizobium sp. WSM2561]
MAGAQTTDVDPILAGFLQKDYELKVGYLTAHFQRMWTRFNYFVLIQAALIGGKTIFGEGQIGTAGLWFGLVLSLLWYVMGAEDRYLVNLYRDQVKESGERVANISSGLHAYCPVGQVPDATIWPWKSPFEWRIPAISTTRLAAIIPLIVSIFWLGLLLDQVYS